MVSLIKYNIPTRWSQTVRRPLLTFKKSIIKYGKWSIIWENSEAYEQNNFKVIEKAGISSKSRHFKRIKLSVCKNLQLEFIGASFSKF